MDEGILVRDIAYSRSGDKGGIANVSVLPYEDEHWELLRERLTAAIVAEHFAGLVRGPVVRYELPGIRALNFVMHDALDGGVATSLRVDGHGKSYQSIILELRV